MSQSYAHGIANKAGLQPAIGGAQAGTENDLAPEIKDEIVARAREIIAGRVIPPAMVAPSSVAKFLERELGSDQPPPTPEAIWQIADRLTLEVNYDSCPVACFTTAEGRLAVLASGEQEITALLEQLTGEEAASVVVLDTEQR